MRKSDMQIKDLDETSEQNIERLQWIQGLPELEIGIDRRHQQEAAQAASLRLQIEDRKDNRTDEQKAIGAYYDRAMNRSDNGTLDYLSDEREDQ